MGTGLAYTQLVQNDNNEGVSVTTIITHESGHWLSSGSLILTPVKKDPQGYDNQHIKDIASQAAKCIDDPIEKYTVTNQALAAMLAEN